MCLKIWKELGRSGNVCSDMLLKGDGPLSEAATEGTRACLLLGCRLLFQYAAVGACDANPC